MKKRLIAFAGGAALVAAAAVPVGSAFAQSSTCQRLESQFFATEGQLISLFGQPQTPSVRAQETALEARLSQIEAAAVAAHCID